jgi:phosphopantothenoylcysteine synthetase/decarboxylase
MTTPDARPVLYVVACGGRPAADLPDFVTWTQHQGWDTCVIATPSGLKFLDPDRLTRLTGHPVRSGYKQPDQPDVLPPPGAFVIAPATFNTINKLTAGISDTLATGLLCEAIGAGLPIIAVPFPNQALARHPAYQNSITTLRQWGIRLIYNEGQLPVPNQAEPGNLLFPWPALRDELAQLGTLAS